jgi:hypothetical protein
MIFFLKKRAPSSYYLSLKQLVLSTFVIQFERKLNPTYRWILLAHLILWDEICSLYYKQYSRITPNCPALNPCVVIRSLNTKYLCNFYNRETVPDFGKHLHVILPWLFLFINKQPFATSLFMEFCKRLGFERLNAINERIVYLKIKNESKNLFTEFLGRILKMIKKMRLLRINSKVVLVLMPLLVRKRLSFQPILIC